MSTALLPPAAISSVPASGALWGVLQTERQDVCAALLAEPLAVNGSIEERCERLQMRLRWIDNALDRLFDNDSGSALSSARR